MLWRTASTAVQDHDTCDMRDVGTSTLTTMTTCKQYSAKFEDFQNMKFKELSQGAIHFYEYLYNTYISWPLFNVNCSVLRPQNLCNPLLAGVHTRFFRIQCRKTVVSISVSNSWIYTYSMRWETGYGETVNSYRWTNPCFLQKTFKASRCSNVRHHSVMSVQHSNVAITPPPKGM